MRLSGVTFVFVFGLTNWGLAQSPTPLKSELVFTQPGELPIILSCPHDGTKPIPGVAIRQGSGVEKFVVVRDTNASLIVQACSKELEKHFQKKPWMVWAQFERKYCDANRPPEGAYEEDGAKPHYKAYHDFLEGACKTVKDKHKKGILLDIHGQAKYPDSICRGTNNGKTITLLRERYGWTGVTGPEGIFGRLDKAGYDVRPKNNTKDQEDAGYNGGYIVQHYGSHTAYAIDAIQLEYGGNPRKKDAVEKTGKDLADAIIAFHKKYLAE